jgi:hypothetical protein
VAEHSDFFALVQQENRTPSHFSERLQSLSVRWGTTLKGAGERIGLSSSSLFAYKKGRLPISDKAWAKLEAAERSLAVEESPQEWHTTARSGGVVAPNTYSSGPSNSPTPEDCEALLADTLRLAERLPGGLGAAYQELILLRAKMDQVNRAINQSHT